MPKAVTRSPRRRVRVPSAALRGRAPTDRRPICDGSTPVPWRSRSVSAANGSAGLADSCSRHADTINSGPTRAAGGSNLRDQFFLRQYQSARRQTTPPGRTRPTLTAISFRSPSDGAAIVMALAMRVLPLVEPPGVRPLHQLPRRKLTVGAGQEGAADAELDAADPRFGRQQGL